MGSKHQRDFINLMYNTLEIDKADTFNLLSAQGSVQSFWVRQIKCIFSSENPATKSMCSSVNRTIPIPLTLSSEDNPLSLIKTVRFSLFLSFSLFGCSTTVNSRRQHLLMGLCHWLPGSLYRIWASGLSAEECRARGMQAADRCNMFLLVKMV